MNKEQKAAEAKKVREWRHKMSPEKRDAFLAKRRKRFASRGVEEQKAYRASLGAEPRKARQREQYRRHRDAFIARQKGHRDRLKADTMAQYGGSCVCCSEDMIEFLTIDHIEPVRNHKRERGGSSLYQKLRKNGWPKGYQVLCFNCNCAKRTKGECPHKEIYKKKFTLLHGIK